MENGEDPFADIWISNWERQCEIELENEPDLEGQVLSERDLATQKLWYLFQNSATAVAQLFKDRNQPQVLWLPFQNAAGTITSLYKESIEALRRSAELGGQAGYQRRTRDVLAWAKKRRRHIRREELISFLTGKTLPGSTALPGLPTRLHHHQRIGPRPRVCLEGPAMHAPAGLEHHHTAGGHHHHLGGAASEFEPALQSFREALSLAPPPPSPAAAAKASATGRRNASPVHNGSELSAFISNELARHKRPAPSQGSPTGGDRHDRDVTMDSPTHKRSRLI